MVAVDLAWIRCPIRAHGTEYRAEPTLTWMSGPTLPVDQVASTNSVTGSGFRVGASIAAKTAAGAAPVSGRHDRVPATCRDQPAASSCIASRLVKVRPRQNESRTYGMGRSTRGLSWGLNARAGSIRVP